MGFPRKNLKASTYLIKDAELFSAYLKLEKLIFNVGHHDELCPVGYIHEKARRVEFEELPKLAQDCFENVLAGFDLDTEARGLKRYPRFIQLKELDEYSIWQTKPKTRLNSIRVRLNGKEVYKCNDKEAAMVYIKNCMGIT